MGKAAYRLGIGFRRSSCSLLRTGGSGWRRRKIARSMANERITVESLKYDRTISRRWECSIISLDEDLLVAEGVFEWDVAHDDLGAIVKGTISREYFWFEEWFNIFRFENPDRTFRNFYA